jgi:hypothetical protein
LKMPMVILRSKMLAKAKSKTSKLVAKPLAEMLAKTVLLTTIIDGEAQCRYVGEHGVDDAKVNGETPYCNSTKVSNSGSPNF